MTSWLCILNRANFDIVKREGIWGVSSFHRSKLLKTKPEDVCAFYLIGEGSRNRPAIAGIFKILSDPFQEFSELFQISKRSSKRKEKELYPYRIHVSPIKIFEPEISFKELIPYLQFIKNKERYSAYVFGKAMVELPSEDMDFIMNFKNA